MTRSHLSKELLEADKSVPIHIKNLQALTTEMFKSPPTWDKYFNQGIMITI